MNVMATMTKPNGNECHLPMGGSPPMNYDNRPFPIIANDGDWEPLGYTYELCCGVYHQSVTLYAAVLMHQSAMNYAAVHIRQSATNFTAVLMHQSTTNHAAVSTHQCFTIYTAVFHTKALLLYAEVLANQSYEIRRGVYTKAAEC